MLNEKERSEFERFEILLRILRDFNKAEKGERYFK